MTAAALGVALDLRRCPIVLIESDDIGSLGWVKPRSPPSIVQSDHRLTEKEFMRETKATFKLASSFRTGAKPTIPISSLGRYGMPSDGVSFQHAGSKARLEGLEDNFEDYSLNTVDARAGKFEFRIRSSFVRSTLGYAYISTTSLYAGICERGPSSGSEAS